MNTLQLMDAYQPYIKRNLLDDDSISEAGLPLQAKTPTPKLVLSPEGRVVLPEAASTPTQTPASTPSALPSALDKIQTPIVREYMAKKFGLGPDTELEAAQDRADNRLMWAQLARAGAGLGSAISGSGKGVDNQFYDTLEKNAERPVSRLMERRASQKERQSDQEAQAARARAQEEMDPNSQASIFARQILSSRSPSTAKNMGAAFNLLSAAKIKELSPGIEKDLDRLAESQKVEKELAGRASEGAATRKNAIELERMKHGWAEQEAQRKEKNELPNKAGNLRKEVTGNQMIRQAQEVAVAYKKIKATADKPTPAGDLSLLTAYMKLLDPNSSVREAEFENAAKAGSLPEQVMAGWERLRNGKKLTDEMRQDFVNQSQVLYQTYINQIGPTMQTYRRLAQEAGINPNDVVIPLGLDEHPQDEKALQWAKANPDDPRAVEILRENGGAP